MSTTTPEVSPPRQPAPPRSAAPLVVSIIAIALGATILLWTVFTAVVPTIIAAGARDQSSQIAVDGVAALDVDVAASELVIVFADVERASLDVRSGTRGPWTLDRRGKTLAVATPDNWFPGWFARSGSATLTLPRALEDTGIDATLSVGAGSVRASGQFRSLGAELGAGDVTLEGSTETLRVEVNAGRADLDIAVTGTARATVNSGTVAGAIRGSGPSASDFVVNAGGIELGMPDVVYQVRSDVSAGAFDNGLRTSVSAPRTVTADVAAGSIRLIAD